MGPWCHATSSVLRAPGPTATHSNSRTKFKKKLRPIALGYLAERPLVRWRGGGDSFTRVSRGRGCSEEREAALEISKRLLF